jgi:quercetin dioxygenase-like cupin family protein
MALLKNSDEWYLLPEKLSREAGMTKNRFMGVCWAMIALIALAVGLQSEEKKESAGPHNIVRAKDLKWTPIMKGCDLAPVSGNPDAEGTPFVIHIRCSDGSIIPAHWHPTDEHLTVLKGTFLVGMGDKFDKTKLQPMNVGDFITTPHDMRHFAMVKGENIVQIHGLGPFKVNWVNPAEVPPPDAAPKTK